MLRILQMNLERARAAHDVAWKDAIGNNVDILAISEPNRKICQQEGWHMDKRGDVAVRICNRQVEVNKIVTGSSYIQVSLEGIELFVVYISPNITVQKFKEIVDKVMDKASRNPKKSMVTGDLNSKSQIWGSPTTDERGQYLEEWMAQMAWGTANSGEHTFERGNPKSHIDVAIAAEEVLRKMKKWQIHFDNPFTYHGTISMEIKVGGRTRQDAANKVFLEKEKFATALKNIDWEKGGDVYEKILKAYNTSLSAERGSTSKKPFWWNEVIAESRNKYKNLRRVYTRANRAGRGEKREVAEQMRSERDKMKREIRRSKRQHCKSLLEELEADIWGEGYRIVTRHLQSGALSYKLPTKRRREIIKKLFSNTNEGFRKTHAICEVPSVFSNQELKIAINAMKNGKAPGPDGLTTEVLKMAHEIAPVKMLEMFNELLRKQEFPKR
ncbi:uncharacterized protein LOC123686562 [Harmonia axyridis]|uniref:uncharacterized protein LOC123686562 n=1 Tax=Harmonia axyridis TaxID=115357 RepID=UPI001E275AC3|nr:uncharacterized protein LOC123686562 [Harmonia axyridis]